MNKKEKAAIITWSLIGIGTLALGGTLPIIMLSRSKDNSLIDDSLNINNSLPPLELMLQLTSKTLHQREKLIR